jgi:hypothetical protein
MNTMRKTDVSRLKEAVVLGVFVVIIVSFFI